METATTESAKFSQTLLQVSENLEVIVNKLNKMETAKGIQEQQKNAISLLGTVNAFKSSAKALGLGIFGHKMYSSLKSVVTTAIDATESYNLFSVAMAKDGEIWNERTGQMETFYQKAIDFQDQLSSKLSIYQPEAMNYQGKFFSALQSQMPNNRDTAYFLSEQLTKAGYDLASLWNTDIETAMNKLQSGITGQARGLRDYGIDITEASLQTTANGLGIEKEVEKMSYAEKELMRYIAILQQGGQAQTDFARTIDSPANQLKVLKDNFKTLATTIGAFFIGALKNVLPVVNGIVMAITEALKAIASLFGIDLNLSFGSAVEDLSSGIDGIGNGIDNATKSAKEFQKQILGFDEINNITPPSKSSGSGADSGASSGIIDSGILKALKEWENGMNNIHSKAQEIRDTILKWLDIDGYKKHMTNFEMILDLVKTIGATFLTWKISSAITTFFEKLGLLDSKNAFKIATGLTLAIGGMTLMINGTQRLLDYGISPQGLVETIAGMVGSATGIGMFLNGIGISAGKSAIIGVGTTLAIQGFQVLGNGIENNDLSKIIGGGLETAIGTIPTVITGLDVLRTKLMDIATNPKTSKFLTDYIVQLGLLGKKAKKGATETAGLSSKIATLATKTVVAVAGVVSLVSSFKDLYESSQKLSKTTAEVGMSMATMGAEGAIIGTAIFPGIGTAIGAVAGTASGFIATMLGIINQTEDLNRIVSESDSIYKSASESYSAYQNKMSELTSTAEAQKNSLFSNLAVVEECKKQLSELVDENGRVVGSEESVQVALNELNSILGTNFTVTEGIITNNGKVIISYDDLNTTVQDYTDKYILNTLKQIAIDQKSTAIKRIIETKDAYKKAQEAYEEYGSRYEEFYNKVVDSNGKVKKEHEATLLEMENHLKDLGMNAQQCQSDLARAQGDMANSTTEIVERMIYDYDLLNYMSEDTSKKVLKFSDDLVEGTVDNIDTLIDNVENGASEISETVSISGEKIIGTTASIGKGIVNSLSNLNLKSKSVKEMSDYNSGISSGKNNTLNIIFSTGNSIKSALNVNLYSIGQNIINGLQNGIASRASIIANSVSSIASNITSKFNSILKIHSPSRVMMESGKYVVLGVAKGIESESNTVYEEMNKLGQGIEVSASDFGVTANVGLNKELQQRIQTEASTSINSNFSKTLEDMMLNAVQNVTVDVNIEAKTEEGVIVKKAVKGINDYITQTGEMPFDLVY